MGNISEIKKKRTLRQFLPDLLSDESLVRKITFENQNLKTSYLIDLVHNLILKYYFKKDNTFNLSSVILKEKYGQHYNHYISYLVNKGIIILDKNYFKGKNARIYKLSDKVLKGNIKRFENKDTILLKKYNKRIFIYSVEALNGNLIDDDIKDKLVKDLYSVDIDIKKSMSYLEHLKSENDVYQKNKYSIESIKEKDIFFHFDNYGRFHTNFTILKSYIRKNYLLIDGEETCEIDIQNSQPLFLNKIIQESSINVTQNELNLYQHLTYNGAFYGYFIEKLRVSEKKQVKEMTYKVLFGRNSKTKYDKIFNSHFPSIHNFIKQYKKENGDYKSISHILQKNESNFLFNKVIRDIYKNYPSIKLITCHDSIICKKSDHELIYRIYREHLINHFSFINTQSEDLIYNS